jgi:outer membrane protein assembly factor BamB
MGTHAATRRSGCLRRPGTTVVGLAVALVLGPATAALATGPAGSAVRGPAAGASVGCQVAGAWAMYQGGPDHSAFACGPLSPGNVDRLRPAWFVSTPGTVSATPAVVGGTVYVGDSTGTFYALNATTGTTEWTFAAHSPQRCFRDQADPFTDQHQTGFGEITSSAAVASVGGRRTVFFGSGGSLFAVDAATGTCLWAQDTDPAHPTSAIEIESSPVVDTATEPPEVIVGNDDNSSPGIAVTGVMAFDARSGALLWKYQPERDLTLVPGEFGGSDPLTLSCGDGAPDPYCSPAAIPDLAPNSTAYADGCGDVWSSPALDTSFVDPAGANRFQGSSPAPPPGWYPKRITDTGTAAADGLVVFGTGNCAARPDPAAASAHGDYVDNDSVFALDPRTGVRVWNFVEPYNRYDANSREPGGGDDDFGSSAVIASQPGSPCPRAVIEGSKSGYLYSLCEATGATLWATQVAQAGQLSQSLVGAIGGFIGSPALGRAGGRPAVFAAAAVPLPFSDDGVRMPGSADSNVTSCPGLPGTPLVPPACVDATLARHPSRMMSLHAVDLATGRVLWSAPSVPTYSALTYTGGVVMDPESTGFGLVAYGADRGSPLWSFPLAAAPASAAAVVGGHVYLGAGEADGNAQGTPVPPQATGIWCFSL